MGARDAPTLAPGRAGAGPKSVLEALADLVAALARYLDPTGAEEDLADSLGVAMAAAELQGRYELMVESDAYARGAAPSDFAREPSVHVLSLAADVRWKDLLEKFVARDVRMAHSAAEVAAKYARGNVLAFAHAATRVVAGRVKTELVKALEGRSDAVAATKAIQALGDFTAGYAETVFRTNVTGAYADGRLAMANAPAVLSVTPALRFTAIEDSRVRPNHAAADGLVAAASDPVWQRLKPPLGYNCRCRLDLVPYHAVKAAGLLDAGGMVRVARVPRGAHPDPGFRP